MHQARDAFLDRSKRAVLVVLDDDTWHLHILLVPSGGGVPRILLECLDRKGHLAVFNLDDFDTSLVANREERVWILNEAPIELADVDESFKPSLKLHEDAEVDNTRHFTINRVAHLILVDERCFLFGLISHAL